eukprot:scaffold411130_cov47-Attheya_sp.AAC.3
MTRDKLYPAGQILYLSPSSATNNNHAGRNSGKEHEAVESSLSSHQHSLRYVSRDKFRDLMLHPRCDYMFLGGGAKKVSCRCRCNGEKKIVVHPQDGLGNGFG